MSSELQRQFEIKLKSGQILTNELSGAVVSRLDCWASDPSSIPAGTEVLTGI